MPPSTLPELVATHEALRNTESLPNGKPLVILTYTCYAVQLIGDTYPIDIMMDNIKNKAHSLSRAVRRLTVQWTPSDVGIPGNERTN